MKRYERIGALFVLIVGLASAYYSYSTLKLGKLSMPDSGFIPFIASSIMVGGAVVWLLTNLGEDKEKKVFWEKGDWVRPSLALALMIVYAVTMEPLGYLLSTLVFMLAWQFIIEKAKPLRAVLIAVIATVVAYYLFSRLLGVPVPEGILAL